MQHPPRNIVIDWLETIWETDLPPSSKLVACCLRRYMNKNQDMAWPSIARITGECGFKSDRTTQAHLQLLCSEGWLGAVGKGPNGTIKYQVATPRKFCAPQITTERGAIIAPESDKELNNTSLYAQEIVDLYHEMLPALPRVKVLTDKRAKQIMARDKDLKAGGSTWSDFFEAVAGNRFLNGLNQRGWRADLEWLTNKTNFIKFTEGKYA